MHLAGAVNTRASRSVQGPPASALSAVPSQSMISAPSDQGLAGQICFGIPTTLPKRRCKHCPLQILHPKASDLAGTANRVPHLEDPFSPSHLRFR